MKEYWISVKLLVQRKYQLYKFNEILEVRKYSHVGWHMPVTPGPGEAKAEGSQV